MTETKNPGEKKLSVSKLTLKPRTETGVVRQSFSHGRSKSVVVEKVKRRTLGGPEAKPEPAPVEAPKKPVAAAPKPAAAPRPAEAPKPSGVVLRTLTEEERVARACARRSARARGGRAQDRRGRGAPPSLPRSGRQDRAEAASAQARRRCTPQARRRNQTQPAKSLRNVSEMRSRSRRLTLEVEEDDTPRVAPPGGGAARPVTARPAAPRRARKERGRLISRRCAPTKCERSVARSAAPSGSWSCLRRAEGKLVREVTIPEAITISIWPTACRSARST